MSDEQKKDVPLQPTTEGSKSEAQESGVTDAAEAASKDSPVVEQATNSEGNSEQTDEQTISADEKHSIEKEPKAALAPSQPVSNPSAAETKEPSDTTAVEKAVPADDEKEAKAKAAAEARAARASARTKKTETEEDAGPKVPSPNQPRLDRIVQILKEQLGEDTVEEAFINERDAHLPYVIIKNDKWLEAGKLLKEHEELKLNYLRNVSGIDQETHMEVAYHLLSLDTLHEFCIKVKTNRDTAVIPSVTLVWPTANWNEREIYDLLGIDFPGHPDLRRIMMSDDWVGHPLRKDYEALDPEV